MTSEHILSLQNNPLLEDNLAPNEKEVIKNLAMQTQVTFPDKFANLQNLCGAKDIEEMYLDHTRQREEMVKEELAVLAGMVRIAMAQTDIETPWCVLFFIYGYKIVLCEKLNLRINPAPDVTTKPSPFIYAMN